MFSIDDESELLFEFPVFEDDGENPWVSMKGTESEFFDLDELHDRIIEIVETKDTDSMDVAEFIKIQAAENMKQRTKPRPKDVHIVLFYPDTDDEGVHTVEIPAGSHRHVILAFESAQECKNFSEVLRSQDFFDPTPEQMDLEALEEYCGVLGVKVQVVPEGTNLKPPKLNAKELNHNPEVSANRAKLERLYEKADETSEFTPGAWE